MRSVYLKNVLDKLTGFVLLCYIIAATAFENYAPTSRLSKYTLYCFISLAFIYMFYNKKIRLSYYNIAIILYGIILTVSFFYTPSVEQGIQTLYWYYTCAALTFFVVNYVDSIKKVYLLIKAYLISGMVLALLLLKFYGVGIFNLAANSIHGVRIGGVLGNENLIGMSLSISCVFSIFLIFYHSRSKAEKVIYILNIVVCFPLILLTGSKKALFLIVFEIIWLVILKPSDKGNLIKRLRYFLIGAIFLCIGYLIITKVKAFWFMTERIDELIRTLKGTGISDSDMGRIYMIRTGLNAFSHSPALGKGVAYSRYVFGTYSHNNYVEILMNTGLAGFLIYYSIYVIPILKFCFTKSYKLQLRILAMFIIVSSLILDVGMVSYYNRYFQILLATISIIFCANGKFLEATNEQN